MKKIIKCNIFDLAGYNECGRCSKYNKCELFDKGMKTHIEKKTEIFYELILDGDDKITD